MEEGKVCKICSHIFRSGESEHNINTHIRSHEYEKPKKQRKIVPKPKNNTSILSFFKNVKAKETIETDNNDPASSNLTQIASPDVNLETSDVTIEVLPALPDLSVTTSTSLITPSIFTKCCGINLVLPTNSNIYESFPFTILQNKPLVFENGNFHHVNCSLKDYALVESSTDNAQINKVCYDLNFSDWFQKIKHNMLNP